MQYCITFAETRTEDVFELVHIRNASVDKKEDVDTVVVYKGGNEEMLIRS